MYEIKNIIIIIIIINTTCCVVFLTSFGPSIMHNRVPFKVAHIT